MLDLEFKARIMPNYLQVKELLVEDVGVVDNRLDRIGGDLRRNESSMASRYNVAPKCLTRRIGGLALGRDHVPGISCGEGHTITTSLSHPPS